MSILGIIIISIYLFSVIKEYVNITNILSLNSLKFLFIFKLFVPTMFLILIFPNTSITFMISCLSITTISTLISKILDRMIAIKFILLYKTNNDIENTNKWQEKLDKMKYDNLGWIAIVIGFSILILITFIRNA